MQGNLFHLTVCQSVELRLKMKYVVCAEKEQVHTLLSSLSAGIYCANICQCSQ